MNCINDDEFLDTKFTAEFLRAFFVLVLQVFGDAHAAKVGFIVLSCQLFFCVIVVMFVTQKAKKQLDFAISSNNSIQSSPEKLQFPSNNNKLEIVVIPKSDLKIEIHRKTLSL